MSNQIEQLVIKLSESLLKREWKLVTAESCTGGGVAYYNTNLAGSSNWFERGFVTYSNLAKEECLGVKHETLIQWGAVSEQTASEMAEGALENSQAQVSIAITGIAGPDGGSIEKPVGTVWFAWAGINFETQSQLVSLKGDRQEIRNQCIEIALQGLLRLL